MLIQMPLMNVNSLLISEKTHSPNLYLKQLARPQRKSNQEIASNKIGVPSKTRGPHVVLL